MSVSRTQDTKTHTIKPFVSGQARARWIIGFLIVSIGLNLAIVVALFSQIDLLSRVAAGQTITRAVAAANDNRLQTTSNSRCPIIHRKQAVLSIVVFAIGRKMRRTDSTSYDSGLHRQ